MRPHLAILLLAALSAPPAFAGVVVVDPSMQSVTTSRLKVTFDSDRPEVVRNLLWKDWNPTRDLAGENGVVSEFWGQSFRGVAGTGFIVNSAIESHTWEVLDSSAASARIRISSLSAGQPSVTTTYLFVADQPWYVVERTVHFGEAPDTASCQLYAPRVNFVASYHALRWRDVSGACVQRGYCAGGCTDPSWDGRWVEHISITNTDSFAVAQIYPDSTPPGTILVRGSGPESYAGWVSPLVPAGLKDGDLTTRMMVAFTTAPADTNALDSLWTVFNGRGAWTLGAPPPEPRGPRIALAASPNPAAGPTRFSWTLPGRGRARLEVLDLAGRRVVTPLDSERGPGAGGLVWDGRGDDGRRVPPGIYLARLVTPRAVATARIVRLR